MNEVKDINKIFSFIKETVSEVFLNIVEKIVLMPKQIKITFMILFIFLGIYFTYYLIKHWEDWRHLN